MDQLKIKLSVLTEELTRCGKKGKKEANTAVEQLNSHLLLLVSRLTRLSPICRDEEVDDVVFSETFDRVKSNSSKNYWLVSQIIVLLVPSSTASCAGFRGSLHPIPL